MYSFPCLTWIMTQVSLYLMLSCILIPLAFSPADAQESIGMVMNIPGVAGSGFWIADGRLNGACVDMDGSYTKTTFHRSNATIKNNGGNLTIRSDSSTWSTLQAPEEIRTYNREFPVQYLPPPPSTATTPKPSLNSSPHRRSSG